MSRFGLLALVALPLCSGYGQSPVAPSSSSTALATNINSSPSPANLPLNVAEVVKLSSAGLSNDVVLEKSGRLHNPVKKCLVGSSATMLECMNHLASLGIFGEAELWRIGRDNPLAAIGIADASGT